MGLHHQAHRVSVDLAKGYRQIQKAAADFYKNDNDRAISHLNHAYNDFSAAMDHAVKAEEDLYKKVGSEIDKGNSDLQKSIDSYTEGNFEAAEGYYNKALNAYDSALDKIH